MLLLMMTVKPTYIRQNYKHKVLPKPMNEATNTLSLAIIMVEQPYPSTVIITIRAKKPNNGLTVFTKHTAAM